jgi:hypothetical protein
MESWEFVAFHNWAYIKMEYKKSLVITPPILFEKLF